MMKKMIAVLAVVACVSFVSLAAASDASVDQEYFDTQFNSLQKSIAEVKGDTSQIVEILGNVFEGTVPNGGTLTGLCNKNGWNLIVLMGHNGIADPDKVMAGTRFTYPSTATEFQTALVKGRPLYNAWLKKQKKTFRVNRISADSMDLKRLNIQVMNVTEQLKIKNMEIDQLKVRLAEVSEQLRIKQLDIQQMNVDQANFQQVNINQLHIKQLEIDNLKQLCKQLRQRCAELESRPPQVVTKKVVIYRDAGKSIVAKDTCKDIPWDADGIWADFPEGAIGSETQLRTEGLRYKYKLVTRKSDNKIHAIKCFKKENIWSLADLSARWGVKLSTFKTFGNKGDGGNLATLVIGIVK